MSFNPIKQQLKSLIESILIEQGIIQDTFVEIEIPANNKHGDFSTNIAFQLARQLKKAPHIIAQELTDIFNVKLVDYCQFSYVNGFINITLNDDFIWSYLKKQFNVDVEYPSIYDGKLCLEYVSANPTGPLHIGHGRWAVLGDALARLLKYVNVDVDSEFYINDAGNQVNLFYDSVNAIKNKQEIPADGYQGEFIEYLATLSDDPLEVSKRKQEETLNTLDVKFDRWFSEKTLHRDSSIVDAIETLKKSGLVYTKDDAVWLKQPIIKTIKTEF